MKKNVIAVLVIVVAMAGIVTMASAQEETVLAPKLTLANEQVEDQDDMCIWIHPEDASLSTIIASDKASGKIMVYDLAGKTIQVVTIDGKPGNIDMRYGFPLGDQTLDIVGYNERDNQAIHLYTIDPETRQLTRADDGAIKTGINYGFTLYHSPKSGKFYAFTMPEDSGNKVEQYELAANEEGKISGKLVRSWEQNHSEGAVADDETATLYSCEEEKGIWKVGAEPDDPTAGEVIAPLGENNFVADAEGITLLYGPDGSGYIIVSSQGNGQFKVYDRKAPHAFIKTFTVDGADDTDGVDVLNVALGAAFPQGLFALHNGAVEPCPVLVCSLDGLGLDTYTGYFTPRKAEAAPAETEAPAAE